MSQILEALITDLSDRQKTLRADRHTHTVYLREYDARDLILNSFAIVLKSIERKATLVDMAVSIGRRLMQRLHVPRNSIKACHTGWFILVSYIEVGLIEHRLQHGKTKKGRTSKYLTYQVLVKDKKALMELWDQIVQEEQLDLFPSDRPPAPWVSGTHETGIGIVKKARPGIIKSFSPEKQPIVFKVLNKLGSTAWMVNQPVFEVLEFYLNQTEGENPLKYVTEKNEQRRESLYIETSSVYRLAKKHLDTNFYHLYNVDFRGRVYCNTAFFHEQASDTAKGLLLLAEGDPLGEEGFYWLLLHAANSWGNDKDTLDNRVEWSLQRLDEFYAYADDPTVNTGWHDADKPFVFLATCMELRLLRAWVDAGNEPEDFVSHLPIALDGSNNGSQHLAAMARDEQLAPYVNLVPSEYPGDLYAYVGKILWDELERLEMQIPSAVYHRFDELMAETIRLQKEYDEAPPRSEKKANAWEAVQTFRNNNRALREALFPVFWRRINDPKVIRKIVKR